MDVDTCYKLVRKTFNLWSRHLLNPFMVRRGYVVGWESGEYYRYDEPVNVGVLHEITRRRAFSFQALDGSAFQLWYQFIDHGRTLSEAHLAYFDSQPLRLHSTGEAALAQAESEEDDEDDGDLSASEQAQPEDVTVEMGSGSDAGLEDLEADNDEPIAWLRIDYEPDAANGTLHHSCHLHFGGVPQGRIPLDVVPNPQQFVEWVFSIRYPELYCSQRLDPTRRYLSVDQAREVNAPRVAAPVEQIRVCLPHLSFP